MHLINKVTQRDHQSVSINLVQTPASLTDSDEINDLSPP